jgi:hypothetical protein
MHLNEFRRTLIPGNEVSFFNLKKNVNGKVKAVKGTLVTIEVDIGQEVLDADGKVVAWTTDVVLAQQIARMLNADQG